jgi:hypothetical protein
MWWMDSGRTIIHQSTVTKKTLNTSAVNGLLGASVPNSAVVVWKPALTTTRMVPSVVSRAHTAMATSSNASAIPPLALLIVKASGASTPHARPHVVAVFSPKCSLSPHPLCMEAKGVRRPVAPWRMLHAAPNSARRIARVTGRTGANVPMVELDPVAWSVALVGPKAVGTASTKSIRQVVVAAAPLSGQT